jgi:hypothetical protein
MAMPQLIIWSLRRHEWVNCRLDETTWLDRRLLSAGHDATLHRSMRCPGIRYSDHQWHLFSHDTTHRVFVAPYVPGCALNADTVEAAAKHMLPMALALYEPRPLELETGVWLVCVGKWLLQLFVNVPAHPGDLPSTPEMARESFPEEIRTILHAPPAQPAPVRRGVQSYCLLRTQA